MNETRDYRNMLTAGRLCCAAQRIAVALSRRIHRCDRGEEGSTLAEMALVLPIMLVVLTGVFSFGIALNQYLVLTNAVNNGARAFAMSAPATNGGVSIMDSGDPCKYAASVIQSAASNLNSSSLKYTITYTPYSTGTASTLPNANNTNSPSCASQAMSQYDIVQIKVVYPVTPVMYGWTGGALSLTAQSAELVQ